MDRSGAQEGGTMSKRKEWKQITKPVVALEFKDGRKINLWVLDVRQYAHLMGARKDFQFYAEKDGSVIYEEISVNGHHATEQHLDHPETWHWVQKWMRLGLASRGHLELGPEESNFPTTTPA